MYFTLVVTRRNWWVGISPRLSPAVGALTWPAQIGGLGCGWAATARIRPAPPSAPALARPSCPSPSGSPARIQKAAWTTDAATARSIVHTTCSRRASTLPFLQRSPSSPRSRSRHQLLESRVLLLERLHRTSSSRNKPSASSSCRSRLHTPALGDARRAPRSWQAVQPLDRDSLKLPI